MESVDQNAAPTRYPGRTLFEPREAEVWSIKNFLLYGAQFLNSIPKKPGLSE
jgi:hypothetical protein